MKRFVASIIGLILAGLTLGAAPASAAAPFCGLRWGSLARSVADMSTAPLVDVRAGRHACYDRLVLDVSGSASGYTVSYVDEVRSDAKGDVVPLRGGARLLVAAHVPAYDSAGNATYSPTDPSELVAVGRFRTLRQVAWAGSFEGITSIGVGVRARLPFRVFVLDGPGGMSRIVIDVAHRW